MAKKPIEDAPEEKVEKAWEPKTTYVPKGELKSVRVTIKPSKSVPTEKGLQVVERAESIEIKLGEDGKGYTPRNQEEEELLESFIKRGLDTNEPAFKCSFCRFEDRSAPPDVKRLEAERLADKKTIEEKNKTIRLLQEQLRASGQLPSDQSDDAGGLD